MCIRDRTAVEVARRNVEENGLSDRMRVAVGSIEAAAGQQFHLILANIIAGVLADLAPALAAALQPEAELLASGIIEERVDSVRQAFRQSGLALDRQEQDGDWWLFMARRVA